jgi:tetratricopeptide (TPR) repeat protein
VIEKEPRNAGALLNAGNCFFTLNMSDKAEHYFRRAVEASPDFADGWFNLGNVYLQKNQFHKALSAYENALKYDREFASALKNIGVTYESRGEYDKAEHHYLEALKLKKVDAALYINLANVYMKKQRFDKAKSSFLHAVKIAPKNIDGWMGLRQLSLLRGDIATYVEATCAVLSRLNGKMIARCLSVLRELEQYDGVDTILAKIGPDEKRCDEMDAERLLALQRNGKDPAQVKVLSKRLNAIPSPSQHVRRALAASACAMHDFDKAYRQCMHIEEHTRQSLKLAWSVLVKTHRYGTAEKVLQEYLKEHPDCFDALFYLAEIEAVRSRGDAAREYLQKALDTGFTNVELIEENPVLSHIYHSMHPAIQ